MKYLTKRLKAQSVRKWRQIVANIKNKRTRGDTCFVDKYWTTCGFCRAADRLNGATFSRIACDVCALNPFCRDARQALHAADTGYYGQALACAKTVLKAIEKEPCERGSKDKRRTA